MAKHSATVTWRRDGGTFSDGRYSRVHAWTFDGGAIVPASAAPAVVPPPLSDPAAVDPEEAFVAALASCHMLWLLHLAQKAGFVIDRYEDQAEGVLARNAEGRMALVRVTLRPLAAFSGRSPSRAELDGLHEKAHTECYLANSVKSEVLIEPRE